MAEERKAVFCTDNANIFIYPRPTCCETEKGGERDTGITSEKGVTKHIAQGYLLYLLTG
jgi:hypothetical protein